MKKKIKLILELLVLSSLVVMTLMVTRNNSKREVEKEKQELLSLENQKAECEKNIANLHDEILKSLAKSLGLPGGPVKNNLDSIVSQVDTIYQGEKHVYFTKAFVIYKLHKDCGRDADTSLDIKYTKYQKEKERLEEINKKISSYKNE